MTTMNVKGFSWVGDMCQKFEALCVDVDEAIYEDTFIYVGNQMRTVGETVSKFYSEVMQDLLSSSSLDSAKDKDAFATVVHHGDAVICKKQKLDNASICANIAPVKPVKSSDGVATAKISVSHGRGFSASEQSTLKDSHSPFNDLVTDKSSTIKNYLTSRQEQKPQFKSFSDSFGNDSGEDFTWSEWGNKSDESLHVCGDVNSTKASYLKDCGSNENELGSSGDIGENNFVSLKKAVADTTLIDNVQDALEVDNEFFVSYTGASKQGKLEESCVLVETDNHFSKSTPENMQKSYKKKIKEVFSPRRWSKAKRDEEQFGGKYEEQFGDTSLSTSTRHRKIQKLPTCEPFDSEWELL